MPSEYLTSLTPSFSSRFRRRNDSFRLAGRSENEVVVDVVAHGSFVMGCLLEFGFNSTLTRGVGQIRGYGKFSCAYSIRLALGRRITVES